MPRVIYVVLGLLILVVIILVVVAIVRARQSPPNRTKMPTDRAEAPRLVGAPRPPALSEAWYPFRDADGRFSIDFPGKPTRSEEPSTLAGGSVMEQKLESEAPSATFLVDYCDLPRRFASIDTRVIFDAFRDGIVTSPQKRLVRETTLRYQRYPCRQLEYRLSDPARGYAATMVIRLFFIRSRMYVLSVNAAAHADTYQRQFFDSFAVPAKPLR